MAHYITCMYFIRQTAGYDMLLLCKNSLHQTCTLYQNIVMYQNNFAIQNWAIVYCLDVVQNTCGYTLRNWFVSMLLPFFHIHGYFSAVIFFLSPRGFQLLFIYVLLWGSLSFTSSLSGAPGTIPLPLLSQSLAVSAAHWALSLSFLHCHWSSCSCADLRAFLGLLWASMFKITCGLKCWR